MSAPMNSRKRKNLEAFFIAVKHPILNEQKDSKLTLFRNGDLIYNHLLTASQLLLFFFGGELFFGSCNSVDKRTMTSLTSIRLVSKFDWSKCYLLGVSPIKL